MRLPSVNALQRRMSPAPAVAAVAARLVADLRYELVPLKSVEAAMLELPARRTVSVTCSPAKGIPATMELSSRLQDLGHQVVPHIAARLVEDRDHTKRIAYWLRERGITEMFLVGGDAPEPAGSYADAASFLADLLDADHGLRHIGVTAYPDGHALIDEPLLVAALHAKQDLLAQAGVAGHATTQMCFDVDRIRSWLQAQRSAGVTLPVHLGIPGVIDRTKLLTMGMRLGIGNSMRFVKKNGGTLSRLFSPTGYDPSKLVSPISAHADALGITGLHSFTFNNVAATAEWQRGFVERYSA